MNFHRFSRRTVLAVIAAGLLPASADPAPAAGPTAKQLIDQVVAARRTSGFTARGRMVITQSGADSRTIQFMLKGRHTDAGADFLYLATYPAAEKGRGVVVHRDGAGRLSGFLREPDGKTTPLTGAKLRQPLFGSDLSIDELSEDIWSWPAPKIIGQGNVCRRDCQIIDTRPPKGSDASFALARVWISPETSLPLRVELYSADNKVLKRTECRNIVKSGGHYSMEKISIESPPAGRQTLLDFSKGQRDIEVPAADFTAEGIAAILKD